jgi:hypothetical protein
MSFRILNFRIPGADTLLIALPGLRVVPEDFSGLIGALQAESPTDAIAVGISPNDYLERRFAETLHETVIEPMRTRYARLVILALSLGALGALRYIQLFPDLDGLILLAPFLGNPGTIAEVERAGGFARWAPPPLSPSDIERPGLLWLKSRPSRPWLHLAYGEEDRFATGAKLLAATLPPDAVTTLPGDHDWPSWTRLWAAMLPRLAAQNLLSSSS